MQISIFAHGHILYHNHILQERLSEVTAKKQKM